METEEILKMILANNVCKDMPPIQDDIAIYDAVDERERLVYHIIKALPPPDGENATLSELRRDLRTLRKRIQEYCSDHSWIIYHLFSIILKFCEEEDQNRRVKKIQQGERK